jgi:hypothetical protein
MRGATVLACCVIAFSALVGAAPAAGEPLDTRSARGKVTAGGEWRFNVSYGVAANGGVTAPTGRIQVSGHPLLGADTQASTGPDLVCMTVTGNTFKAYARVTSIKTKSDTGFNDGWLGIEGSDGGKDGVDTFRGVVDSARIFASYFCDGTSPGFGEAVTDGEVVVRGDVIP